MRTGTCEVRVLVKGRPITEFKHESQIFVEGRAGSEFEIELKNNTPKRVMAVISVDGLSVINGDTAGPDSPGYVLNAFQTITIPGWKLTDSEAAKFTFGGRKDSYAQLGKGNATNCGVIGVMLWSEKVAQVTYSKSLQGVLRGSLSDSWAGGIQGQLMNGPMVSGSSGSDGWTANAYGSWSDTFGTYSMTSNSLGDTVVSAATATASAKSATLSTTSTLPASVNNLGTEFGKATQFATMASTFEKDAIIDMLALYYDDARGLRARGIVLERPSRQQYSTTPEPFPGMNCKPPKGWRA